MRGLLDWGAPLEAAGRSRFAAFERDDYDWALPDALELDRDEAGRPAFRLSAFRSIGIGGAAEGYGRLDIGFRLGAGPAGGAATRMAPPVAGAVWVGSAMLDLPPAFADPIPLDCAGIDLATLAVPLPAEGVRFVEQSVEDGALPVVARTVIEVQGVAARCPGTAVVDLARLPVLLASAPLDRDALAAAIARDAGGAGVTVEGAGNASPLAVAEAAADRIRAWLCPGPLVATKGGALALRFADAGVATGKARLDLAEPVVTSRTVALALDPFAAARALAAGAGGVAALVERHATTTLAGGRHRLAVASALANAVAGPLALGATVRFPPRPPDRPQEVRLDVELPGDGSAVVRDVSLAPGEPLDWTLQGFALWPTRGGTAFERLEGPERAGSGPAPLLHPDAWPLRFVAVEAGPALLGLADVRVALGGSRDGAAVASAALLTSRAPRATLALPEPVAGPELTATLLARAGGAELALPPRPAGAWRIEMPDVPGYGPRSVEVSVRFPAGATLVAVDLLPEDAPPDEEAHPLAFTPDAPQRTFRWLCGDPFRPGLRWRWRGEATFRAPTREATLILLPEAAPA